MIWFLLGLAVGVVVGICISDVKPPPDLFD